MNFAIIGCGVIAFTHAKALEALRSEGCELYGACDIIPQKAEDFAAEHGVPHVYYDYHDVLADPAVDIVCVCVPSGTHGEICIAAAIAGKAIVCEKPMEITPENILDVISIVKQKHVKMQCIFQRRMMPVAIAVRQAIADGKFGKICISGADLKYYRDQAYYDSAGWRGTWEQDGGGALMNQGVHGIDLILWMLNDEVEMLYGRAETLARNIQVEDTAAAILHMRQGGLCVIQGCTTAYPGFSSTFYIHGEKGTVVFNDEGIIEWTFLDEENAPERPDMGERVGGAGDPTKIGNYGHISLLRDIAEAVRNDRAPIIPPEEATTAVSVICSIYESTQKGTPIVFETERI